MIEKSIDYSNDAKMKLASGVNKLADAVKTTLGAAGSTVILEDELGRPHITKDGVTVAKSINLEDPVEHLGASVVKQVSIEQADGPGDGTTTAIVIAQKLINDSFDLVKGLNVTKFRNELEKASKTAVDDIEKKSKPVTDENLVDVATISANNDDYLGRIIAEAYLKVGKDGSFSIEESGTGETYTEIVEGTRIKKGFHSPYLITNVERGQVVQKEPYILISDKEIKTIEEIEPVLVMCKQQNRAILIVADVDIAVMNVLNVNKRANGLKVNVVAPEGIGSNRYELLEDLAIMTGAVLVSDETGNDFITDDFLGSATKVVSDSKETVITLKPNDIISSRADVVRELISTHDANEWHYKDRLSRLAGGVAAIYVGALTEVEMKEKKDRVEDAILATRSALEEGIVAGGGVALFNASQKLTTIWKNSKQEEEKAALECLIAALQQPLITILDNAEYPMTEFAQRMSKIKRRGHGLDVKNMRYGNMFDMGIVDPLKVTKNAVKNAVSVAITVLTTDCVVSNKRA